MVDVDLVHVDEFCHCHLLFKRPILDCLRAKLVHDVQVHSSSRPCDARSRLRQYVNGFFFNRGQLDKSRLWCWLPGENRVPLTFSLWFSDHKMLAYAPISDTPKSHIVGYSIYPIVSHSQHIPVISFSLSAQTSVRTSRRMCTEPTLTKSESVRLGWRNQRTAVEGQKPQSQARSNSLQCHLRRVAEKFSN